MWAHYADNYTGICIEYRASQLLHGLPDDADLVRMAYDDLPPRITSRDSNNPENAARKIFSQKSLVGLTNGNGEYLHRLAKLA